jgi:transposase-like protein
MDVHENAGTTPHRRRLMVGRLAAGRTVAAVTASFGVNPKTMRKWCYQHAAEGEASLLYRSSRPHRTPSRLAEEATAKLETLRRQCLPGLPSPAASVGRSRPWACSCAGVGSAGSRPLRPSRRRSAIGRSDRAS